MRRRTLVALILLALAGAAVAGTFITLALTGSNEPAGLVRKARRLVGALPQPRRVHLKTRATLPKLKAPALRRLERMGPNEKSPRTDIRSSAALVSNSSFPETQAVPGSKSAVVQLPGLKSE
jgi:hypothetical protein